MDCARWTDFGGSNGPTALDGGFCWTKRWAEMNCAGMDLEEFLPVQRVQRLSGVHPHKNKIAHKDGNTPLFFSQGVSISIFKCWKCWIWIRSQSTTEKFVQHPVQHHPSNRRWTVGHLLWAISARCSQGLKLAVNYLRTCVTTQADTQASGYNKGVGHCWTQTALPTDR